MAAPRVILVRHAHAEWPDYHGRDFDRPLTARGRSDAARSAAAIRAADLKPDALLVSPALRTRETASIIAAALGVGDAAIQYIDDLYNASARTLEQELRRAAARHGLVMLVAHNPGISELGRALTEDPGFAPFAPADWRQFAVEFT
jgi:phosphohistidine phosphatase